MSDKFASDDVTQNILQRVMSRVPDRPVSARAPEPENTSVARTLAIGAGEAGRLSGIYSQTRVTTNFGKVPAHLLRVNDVVRTRTGHFLPISDIRALKLDLDFVRRHPDTMPVLVLRGAVQTGVPSQDILLSPAQRVAVGSSRVRPDMVRARELPRAQGRLPTDLDFVTYYQVVLDVPAEIECEGLWVRAETRGGD